MHAPGETNRTGGRIIQFFERSTPQACSFHPYTKIPPEKPHPREGDSRRRIVYCLAVSKQVRNEEQRSFQRPAFSRQLDCAPFAQIVPNSTCSHPCGDST